ncbi:hypothetical protein KL930_002409 [Ogataea haglerorum]|uniref:TauD/TfdA-like domain-containing protein n=1 Tax=Ogataea haglerorum TaxID=1937702 RepID=A0AAN6D7U0_9ASCO|nr:uncharacterized protein KL911_002288 [Ogataea haglerorum]KAG7697140.1 hypothetical protein KL915_002403 [Ogataea haglerorum]KAG7697171.1 hypothetical protein KL951_002533 [Ogataea haglerorum]KAG7707810.1 hypothetical protein KL914_002631 [Ogataea haglerorum]KAG7709847.1 hypothetical protein KL950_002066 [Ogataea haglerorum]KAG7719926.1 hypothetical protein KL913_001895 [Ogataea haglerorum]
MSSTTTLKLQAIPVDKEIENLIRSSKEIAIGLNANDTRHFGPDPDGLKILPETTRKRLVDAGIDISEGYPSRPDKSLIPVYVDEAAAIRDDDYEYIERAKKADPEKKALLGAAKQVIHLTNHIGTEIVGLQLEDLTDQQKDELALLVAERVVVFFRDQKLSPQKQLELGEYWGRVEKHPQASQVNGLPGVSVIWQDYFQKSLGVGLTFKNNNLGNFDATKNAVRGTQVWHTDLVHEKRPAGLTHLHLDAIPEFGGDTLWASGYAAYDKLSEEFKKFLDGKQAVYVSAHGYLDRKNPFAGPKKIERVHPIIRTHPATGWKSLFVNRGMTKRIVGLSSVESDLILNYLFEVFEKNADIQVRFKWTPSKPGYGTSAIWDNRVSQHRSTWDHEGKESRHGTRVTSLAELPYFDPESKSQREALGLPLDEKDFF